jgi:hypothetical protein
VPFGWESFNVLEVGNADRLWDAMSVTQVFRIIVVLDIEQFGLPDRDDQIRVEFRRGLRRQLTDAMTGAGIQPQTWSATGTGDGLLVLIDPAVEIARIVQALMDRFRAGLIQYNRTAGGLARLRVRAVVHAGYMLQDEQGVVGEEVTLTFRLLDAPELRMHLTQIPGPLVVAVSAYVYDHVVRHRLLGLEPAQFRKIIVKVKETSTKAWIHPAMTGTPRSQSASAAPLSDRWIDMASARRRDSHTGQPPTRGKNPAPSP